MSSTFPILTLAQPDPMVAHLRECGWIGASDPVESLDRAGEGNMNLVVRVRTSAGSFILKQSRPWVEKYPQIPAPADRLFVEVGFYEAVGSHDALAGLMPRLLGFDEGSRCAWIEDLGESADCTSLYAGARMDLASLVDWLSILHGTPFSSEIKSDLRNRAMRALNHAHIFDLPMSGEHGLDLDTITPGLGEAAEEFRGHAGMKGIVRRLGDQYLSDGDQLLHGDFYPGSWLSTKQGLRVIDPEFCFFGPAEFDLGVLQAHLVFSGYDGSAIETVLSQYSGPVDEGRRLRFAGVEIMRRLIGVAQLPLERSLAQKQELLDTARSFLKA